MGYSLSLVREKQSNINKEHRTNWDFKTLFVSLKAGAFCKDLVQEGNVLCDPGRADT